MGKGGKIAIGCLGLIVVLGVILVISGIGIYNSMVTLDEGVNSTWSEVQNQYQRRFDLIPNLVETVKGYASHEKETLTAVTEARSKVGGVMNLKAEDLTQANLAKFQQAQAGLSGALQRLMVVVERYPDLKANQNFIRLQDELAGTENRITVARQRFNTSVQGYKQRIRRFPGRAWAGLFGFEKRAYFEAAEGSEEAPKVKF